MARIHQVLEIFLAAKVVIEFVKIPAPIAMVATISIINNGGNPDRIETHPLDIVQVVDNPSVTTSAVVS